MADWERFALRTPITSPQQPKKWVWCGGGRHIESRMRSDSNSVVAEMREVPCDCPKRADEPRQPPCRCGQPYFEHSDEHPDRLIHDYEPAAEPVSSLNESGKEPNERA